MLPSNPTNALTRKKKHKKEKVKWTALGSNRNDPVIVDNDIDFTHQPTDPRNINSINKHCYNFTETFDRPVFTSRRNKEMLWRNKTYKHDANGNKLYSEVIFDKGYVKDELITRNRLTEESYPYEWFMSFLGKDLKLKTSNVCFKQWTTYINHKALLMKNGNTKFKTFNSAEIKQFHGLFILKGLSPLPQIQHKFIPQVNDLINSNNLCHCVFGSNGKKRYQEFKRYFSMSNPVVEPSPKNVYPNWKV